MSSVVQAREIVSVGELPKALTSICDSLEIMELLTEWEAMCLGGDG